MMKKFKKFTIFLFIMDILACICLFIMYGPISYFKELWVTSAMASMENHFLAYTFYNEDTILGVLGKNYIKESDEIINLDDIVIDSSIPDYFSSIYEEQIFTKDSDNDIYKIIPIKESSYVGYLTVVYDPADVDLVVSSKLGRMGETITKMAKDNDGLVGINGGGFEDLDGWGNGSKPYGAVIQDGELVYDGPHGDGGLIGFTTDNKMYLTKEAPEVAIANGMEDAVEFGPFLIVNGVPAEIAGNGGWGIAPRTVIAQRKDGIVLMLVIDGRLPGYSLGADMNHIIELLLRYGAYNAANLDGGASTTMSVDGKLYNKPSAGGEYGGRTVSNGWIVKDNSN